MKRHLLKIASIIAIIILFSNTHIYSQRDISTVERVREYVKYLASDELEGRFPGTLGMEKAQNYIKNHFSKIGLQTFNNSYLQEFSVATGLKLGTENKLSASVLVERVGVPVEQWKPGVRNYEVTSDWQPVPFSENGTVTGQLVFAGYGITAESLNYDDYKNIDVKGKVCMILLGSPEGSSEKSKFYNYLSLRHKATTARNNGAVGVLFVNPQGDSADVIKPLKFEMMSKNSGIVAAHFKRSIASKLLPRNVQINYVENEINKKKTPNSFDIPYTTITLTVDLQDDMHATNNVIGFVKGTKYPDEYIVVGGHYDHLGYGQMGNSTYRGSTPMIHNGADDNASGTAGVMELAERFAKHPAERTIVFMSFSGEEMGLLGSNYYVEHNYFPHNKTALMLNFDMIGRMKENKVQIFGLGSAARFDNDIDSLANIDSIIVVKLQDGFGPSDHSSFYKNNVPVMHFFTGTHGDYHSPSDDWDKIDYVGLARIADFAEDVVRHYASLSERPSFIKVVDTSSQVRATTGGHGAWFGIVPNFEESPLGCKISGTSPGSPAAAAGLQENDIITHIDGKAVKNLYDFMYIVGEHKPGDKLKVKVLRNEKEKEFEVTLSRRN